MSKKPDFTSFIDNLRNYSQNLKENTKIFEKYNSFFQLINLYLKKCEIEIVKDAGREIRTPEGLCHWILSPAPLISLDP